MKPLDLAKTALVIIDLQQDILHPAPLYPWSAQAVVVANDNLIQAFKNTQALIALVAVKRETFAHLYPFNASRRHLPKTQPQLALPIAQDPDADNVITVYKHNPSAFFGTDLDLQLRRFGIDTIILSGVSTSNGVYATALDAYQYGYHVLLAEDACADRDVEKHDFFFAKMFPNIATVTTVEALAHAAGK